MEKTKYVTTSTAARMLGLSSESIRSFAVRGILPALRTESGVRLFERTAIEDLARERAARRARADAEAERL